jgi:filamentous hemagglutinin
VDGYAPPYLPNSDIVQFSSPQVGQYVRLYGNGSKQAGTWIVRAQDIAGLTQEQIASKFSLPQVQLMKADVTLPPGTWLNASVANGISPKAAEGIFTGDNVGGGGVQFQIDQQSMLRLHKGEFDSWFSNERPIK